MQELELELGVDLFTRKGPRLALTADGEALASAASDALGRLTRHIADLRARQGGTSAITLSMLPSLAAKWMAPRLVQFTRDHPDIDLRLSASRHLVDFGRERVDAAIRYGRGGWSGVEAEMLHTERIMPVCSPSYRAQFKLEHPSDLAGATFLHGDLPERWEDWLAAAGVPKLVAQRGPRFGDDTSMLEAAAEGLGVALGRSALVEQDLQIGRLVAPFAASIPASLRYWLVTPAGVPPHPQLAAVRGWLLAQFGG